MAGALTRAAFEIGRMRWVEIRCASKNVASAGIPPKLGFTHEATLKDRLTLASGEVDDALVFTLLAHDYPASAARRIPSRRMVAGGGAVGLGAPSSSVAKAPNKRSSSSSDATVSSATRRRGEAHASATRRRRERAASKVIRMATAAPARAVAGAFASSTIAQLRPKGHREDEDRCSRRRLARSQSMRRARTAGGRIEASS